MSKRLPRSAASVGLCCNAGSLQQLPQPIQVTLLSAQVADGHSDRQLAVELRVRQEELSGCVERVKNTLVDLIELL